MSTYEQLESEITRLTLRLEEIQAKKGATQGHPRKEYANIRHVCKVLGLSVERDSEGWKQAREIFDTQDRVFREAVGRFMAEHPEYAEAEKERRQLLPELNHLKRTMWGVHLAKVANDLWGEEAALWAVGSLGAEAIAYDDYIYGSE